MAVRLLRQPFSKCYLHLLSLLILAFSAPGQAINVETHHSVWS